MFDTMLSREIRQSLDDFRRTVDRFFSDIYAPASWGRTDLGFTPPLESGFTESEWLLRVILPGVSAKDVNVTTQNGLLVIEGERKAPEGWQEPSWTRLAYGKFRTEVPVPQQVDLEKVNCQMRDGILEVHLALADHAKPRRIQIQTEAQRSIPAAA